MSVSYYGYGNTMQLMGAHAEQVNYYNHLAAMHAGAIDNFQRASAAIPASCIMAAGAHEGRFRVLRRSLSEAFADEGHRRRFTMWTFSDALGRPCCVAGHYAHRTDLQDTFRLERNGLKRQPGHQGERLSEHFGLSEAEAAAFFGCFGCGGAMSLAAALAYIDEFIAHRWPEPAPLPESAIPAIPQSVREIFEAPSLAPLPVLA